MNDEQRPARNGQSRPEDWRVWLGWVLASTIGWGVGGPAGVAAGGSGDIIVAGYAGVAAGGTLAGVLQWLVLRRHVAGAGWWMAAGPVGALIGGVVIFAGAAVVGADAGWVFGAGLFGPLVGVLQWRVLRRRVTRAGWWVAASAAGWVAAGPGVGLVSAVMDAALTANAGWAALGIMYGAVTGCALVWLLRQPRPAAATG